MRPVRAQVTGRPPVASPRATSSLIDSESPTDSEDPTARNVQIRHKRFWEACKRSAEPLKSRRFQAPPVGSGRRSCRSRTLRRPGRANWRLSFRRHSRRPHRRTLTSPLQAQGTRPYQWASPTDVPSTPARSTPERAQPAGERGFRPAPFHPGADARPRSPSLAPSWQCWLAAPGSPPRNCCGHTP